MGDKKQGKANRNISEIDTELQPSTGKRIFYQLTDAEGGTSENRKVPAIVVLPPSGQRDAKGHPLSRLGVFGPNGYFNVDAASDGSREPGTWDTYQPGDLGS